jgi:uncharacterized protein YbbK (DUF523 family)
MVPVCLEIVGGLPTLRPSAEIQAKDGITVINGCVCVMDSMTEIFLSDARQALHLAEVHSVTRAPLKENSPSCGSNRIDDGSFSKIIKDGQGVTAAKLLNTGLPVSNEYPIDQVTNPIQR